MAQDALSHLSGSWLNTSWGDEDDLTMCLSSSSRLTRAHSCDGAHSSEAQQESKPQRTNAFQTFSHIMAVNVPLAKEVARPAWSRCGRALP